MALHVKVCLLLLWLGMTCYCYGRCSLDLVALAIYAPPYCCGAHLFVLIMLHWIWPLDGLHSYLVWHGIGQRYGTALWPSFLIALACLLIVWMVWPGIITRCIFIGTLRFYCYRMRGLGIIGYGPLMAYILNCFSMALILDIARPRG